MVKLDISTQQPRCAAEIESIVPPEQGPRRRDRDGLYKRRNYWHFELMIDGRKRSFTTGTSDYNTAKKVRAEAIRNRDEGTLPDDSGRRRFDVVADEYIAHRQATVAAGTLRIERERLKPLKQVIGNVALKNITSKTVRSYQSTRAAEVSNRTTNLETKLLRGILQFAGQWKRLESEYKRLQETSESPGRALSPEESLRLFETAAANDDWACAYHAAVIANDGGCRGVELRNLRLRDIDLEAREIHLRKSKLTTSHRTILLTQDAYAAVSRLIQRAAILNATKPEHYLFPYKLRTGGYDPTRPTKGWRTAWRKLTAAAGLSGFRFHDLRHTFITSHAEIGTPLPVVMAQAGHLSRKMTELYTHISNQAMQKAAQKFEEAKRQAMAEARKKLEVAQPATKRPKKAG